MRRELLQLEEMIDAAEQAQQLVRDATTTTGRFTCVLSSTESLHTPMYASLPAELWGRE
jgi:hypothetical protein